MKNKLSNAKEVRQIPFNLPSIGEEEIKEVCEVLRSGWITSGPRARLFEENFSRYTGAKYALAVNSCTAGLHLALVASGVGPGDEVITTPNTFAATAAVIVHSGAIPVFADTESGSYNISPDAFRDAITRRTKAIIPVHFAGEPCKMDEILNIAQSENLLVIEDAAHALGAEFRNIKIGAIGNATAFSFYATKNLTTGEGGMITTDDRELAERMRLLSLHGLSRDAWKRYSKEGHWYYEICEAGFKYNMSDIQAAIGIKQLEKFDQMQKRREDLIASYYHYLSSIEEILLPPLPNDHVRHAWHLFVIRLNHEINIVDRDTFIGELNQKGIGTSVHFIPLHMHPYYRTRFGFKVGDFPNAEAMYYSSVSLPLYPQMDSKDVRFISDTIKNVMMRNKRKMSTVTGKQYA